MTIKQIAKEEYVKILTAKSKKENHGLFFIVADYKGELQFTGIKNLNGEGYTKVFNEPVELFKWLVPDQKQFTFQSHSKNGELTEMFIHLGKRGDINSIGRIDIILPESINKSHYTIGERILELIIEELESNEILSEECFQEFSDITSVHKQKFIYLINRVLIQYNNIKKDGVKNDIN